MLCDLLGDTLVTADGAKPTSEVLADASTVALYFSAHWCPPCRAFTPKLAESYKASFKSEGMRVVFVSSDKSAEAFAEYFSTQPWSALPFEERDLQARLKEKYEVPHIPTLVILDATTGKVITTSGREAVTKDPTGKDYPWKDYDAKSAATAAAAAAAASQRKGRAGGGRGGFLPGFLRGHPLLVVLLALLLAFAKLTAESMGVGIDLDALVAERPHDCALLAPEGMQGSEDFAVGKHGLLFVSQGDLLNSFSNGLAKGAPGGMWAVDLNALGSSSAGACQRFECGGESLGGMPVRLRLDGAATGFDSLSNGFRPHGIHLSNATDKVIQ
jgi:thiol-disulfide isomerase/thioredoxin